MFKAAFCFQDSENRLTELRARAQNLQTTGDRSVTQENLPADVTVTKDLDRYFTSTLISENQR